MTTTTLSKKATAALLYAQLTAAGKPRKEVLFEMVEKAGLTQSGAATYFNNFKQGIWPIPVVTPETPETPVVESVAVPQINLSEMKLTELVELYNVHASAPVKKFKDRATAERRVREVLPA